MKADFLEEEGFHQVLGRKVGKQEQRIQASQGTRCQAWATLCFSNGLWAVGVALPTWLIPSRPHVQA